MIVDRGQEEIIQGGNRAKKIGATIKMDAKMFQVLGGSYTDKIESIERELGSNALDSHKEKGNIDQPFDVHLPSELNNTFYIRDYGVGMSDSFIRDSKNGYMAFGTSTKRKSNDYLGTHGLGSKSPLAYQSMYNLTSWYDGYKRDYTIYNDEDGIPCIMLNSSSKSDEPTGVMVSFSVEEDHFDIWASKASEVFRRFPIKPNFLGEEIKFVEYEYIYKDEHIGILKNGYTPKSKVVAIQGCVEYPINLNALTNDTEQHSIMLSNILNKNIEFYFNIGDVRVIITRESLDMDEHTQNNILKKFEHLRNVVKKDVEKSFEGVDLLWEKVRIANELCGNNGKYSIKESSWSSYNRGYNKISRIEYFNKFIYDIQFVDKSINIDLFDQKFDWIDQIKYNGPYANSFSVIKRDEMVNSVAYKKNKNYCSFKMGSDVKFFIADTTNTITEIYDNAVGNGTSYVFYVKRNKEESLKDYLDRCKNSGYEKILLEHIECPTNLIKYISELNIQKDTTSNKTIYKKGDVFVYSNSNFYKNEFDKIHFSKGGVYVEFNSGVPDADVVTKYATKIRELNFIEAKPSVFIGIPKRTMSEIKDNPNWIKLDYYYEKSIKEYFNTKIDENSRRYLKIANEIDVIKNINLPKEIGLFDETKVLDNDIVELIQYFREFEKNRKEYRDLSYSEQEKINKLKSLAIKNKMVYNTENEDKWKLLDKKLSDKYPLLTLIGYNSDENVFDHMIKYLNYTYGENNA